MMLGNSVPVDSIDASGAKESNVTSAMRGDDRLSWNKDNPFSKL